VHARRVVALSYTRVRWCSNDLPFFSCCICWSTLRSDWMFIYGHYS
jgi:hypothetical protein